MSVLSRLKENLAFNWSNPVEEDIGRNLQELKLIKGQTFLVVGMDKKWEMFKQLEGAKKIMVIDPKIENDIDRFRGYYPQDFMGENPDITIVKHLVHLVDKESGDKIIDYAFRTSKKVIFTVHKTGIKRGDEIANKYQNVKRIELLKEHGGGMMYIITRVETETV